MKIVDVRSTIAALQRRRSLKTSYGESPDTVTVVVQVYTDEGITGIGQTVAPAPFYGDTAEAIKVNILHFKIHKYGGLLQAKRMAAIGEAAGLELSSGGYFDILAAAGAHFAASTPNVKWPSGFSDMVDTLLTEPYEPRGQVLEPPEGPGLGVELHEDKLAVYGSKWE